MKKINKKEIVLDQYEQEIENALPNHSAHAEDFHSFEQELKQSAAHQLDLMRTKPITMRVRNLDLLKIKAKAKAKDLPYQTLLGLLLHQYAQGKIKINL